MAVYKSRLFFRVLKTVCFFLVFYFFLPWCFKYDAEEVKGSYRESYRIFDRNDTLLRNIVNDDGFNAYWLNYNQIPPVVIEAVIAAEDNRFLTHNGIDILAFGRAFIQNILKMEIYSGASTISMQLARLIENYPRNIFGKIGQVFSARRLEIGLSKEEILALYINMVAMGGGNTGMEAGAREYFGTSLNLLSKSQVSLLTGIIQGPGIFNPFINKDGALIRRNYVLDKMNELDFLSDGDLERGRKEPIILVDQKKSPMAMHFTDYVMKKINHRDHEYNKGGDIETTLDENLNSNIQSLLKIHIQKVQSGGITHGAVLVLDNKTMEILAMVGSPDYWDGDKGSNNGTITLRQPGSTLKPFTYATAFSLGWSPADVIPDVPISYLGGDQKLYEPENFSGNFSGPVILGEALGRSLNIPAIRLANSIGIENLLVQFKKFGFKSLSGNTDHYGLGLTLGNGEVTLLELVRAYSIFPNKGFLGDIKILSDIEIPLINNRNRVMDEELCFLITDILANENLRMRAFGFNNPLLFEFPISIKTGTSNNWKDNWVVGYTKDHTIGVWVGNFSGAPTNQFSGAIGAGPLFQQVARLVHYSTGESNDMIWKQVPKEVVNIDICPVSGKIPSKFCSRYSSVNILKSTSPSSICNIHRLVEIDTRNGFLANDQVPEKYKINKVFEYLGSEYYTWEAQLNRKPPPDKFSPLGNNSNYFKIINPRPDEVYIFEPGYNAETQSINLKVNVKYREIGLFWFINNEKYEIAEWPYETSLPIVPGRYKINFGTDKNRSEDVIITVK